MYPNLVPKELYLLNAASVSICITLLKWYNDTETERPSDKNKIVFSFSTPEKKKKNFKKKLDLQVISSFRSFKLFM